MCYNFSFETEAARVSFSIQERKTKGTRRASESGFMSDGRALPPGCHTTKAGVIQNVLFSKLPRQFS